MNLWSVFVTGLLAGGASCVVVQGGLLAGAVGRRHEAAGSAGGLRDDAVPVGGFLAGKLLSHVILGALLGLIGDAAQLDFRTRAYMQIGAGVLMVLLALNLLGVRALRRLVPPPPPAVTRFVRRSGRYSTAFGPALLGFFTVLVPCGVTLSVMFLAVASGSPLTGAVGMGVFVIGTSPLFAALGYALRRSGTLLGGYLGKAAAVAVIVAALVSINSGLVLSGSSFTLESAWGDLTGGDAQATGSGAPADRSGGVGAVTMDAAGVQQIVIQVGDGSYSPSAVSARAGIPTRLVLRTNGVQGCTRAFVLPDANIEKALPETGDTIVDLGPLSAGRLRYTCGMGMYSGVIDVI